MKPAALRPPALRDQQREMGHDRQKGRTGLVVNVAKTTNEALDQVGLGSWRM